MWGADKRENGESWLLLSSEVNKAPGEGRGARRAGVEGVEVRLSMISLLISEVKLSPIAVAQ